MYIYICIYTCIEGLGFKLQGSELTECVGIPFFLGVLS